MPTCLMYREACSRKNAYLILLSKGLMHAASKTALELEHKCSMPVLALVDMPTFLQYNTALSVTLLVLKIKTNNDPVALRRCEQWRN